MSDGAPLATSARARNKIISKVETIVEGFGVELEKLLTAQMLNAAKIGNKDANRKTGVEVRFTKSHAEAIIDYLKARGGGGMAAVFTRSMSKQITSALRGAVVSVYTDSAFRNLPPEEMMVAIRERWIAAAKNKNNVAFIDSAGRVWDTLTYIEMNVRTNTMTAYNESMLEGITQGLGSDLIMISNEITGDTCEICRKWAGRILSVNGKTKGFPTLATARGQGLFHPNCIHTIEPIDEEWDAKEIAKQRKMNGGEK